MLLLYTCSIIRVMYICFKTDHDSRGGGDLLRQLHALAEVELELSTHQKQLAEIEAKVILNLHFLSILLKCSRACLCGYFGALLF